MRIIIVTGLSGAGRSAALHCFEDMDFYCVDNLPPRLIPEFIEMLDGSSEKNIAFVTDSRAGDFFSDIYNSLDWLEQHEFEYEILYLEADMGTLVGRYDFTRRTHPLRMEGITMEEAIERERDLLRPLRERADRIIDTGNITARQLSSAMQKIYGGRNTRNPLVTIISFGYKYGVPLDADIMYDMRFLPNPYYIESMRCLTGRDEPVMNYVMGSDEAKHFLEQTVSQLRFMLPLFVREGKSEVVICVGCTGGQHRSVAFAEALLKALQQDSAQPVEIVHRDMARSRTAESSAKDK